MNYRKIETPDGKYSIRYAIRRGRYLVMFTSFDAMRYIDFAEGMANACQLGMTLESVYTYDDETGFYIFSVDLTVVCNHRYRSMLYDFIENAFEEYFK